MEKINTRLLSEITITLRSIVHHDVDLREESFSLLKVQLKSIFSSFIEKTLVAVCRSAFACDILPQCPRTKKVSSNQKKAPLKFTKKLMEQILTQTGLPSYTFGIFTESDFTDDQLLFQEKVSIIKRAIYSIDAPFQLLSGIMDVFYVKYRYVLSKEDIDNFMQKGILLAQEDTIDKWFKFHSNYLFCLLEGLSDFPIDPKVNSDKPGCIFGGRTRKFIFNKIKFFQRYKVKGLTLKMSPIIGFFYSLMDCKRSFPILLENRRTDSLMKHKACLTGEQYEQDTRKRFDDLDSPRDYLDRAIKVVPAIVRSVFKGTPLKGLNEIRLPTNNSCFESGRGTGGNLGFLHGETSGGLGKYFQGYTTPTARTQPIPIYSSWDGTDYLSYLVNRSNRLYKFNMDGTKIDLDSLRETVRKLIPECDSVEDVPTTDELTKIRTTDPFYPYLENEDQFLISPTYRESEFLINKCVRSENVLPATNACVATIAEPMKFRIVTSGESFRYSLVRPLQKVLWSKMSRCLPFKLTGETVSESVLDEVYCDYFLKASIRNNKPFTYIAGDYSNATDNMHPKMRDQVWDEICKTLGLHSKSPLNSYASWAQLGQSTLGDHIIFNEDLDLKYKSSHGQLMGSPLSFIILCIANMAILFSSYLLSKERRGSPTGYSLETSYTYFTNKYGVLVNGDDLSIRVRTTKHRDFYGAWEDISTSVGMSPSIGKNFISDSMILINSTPFMVHKGLVPYTKMCQRLNPGLIRGQGKVLSDSRKMSPVQLDEQLLAKCDQLDCVLGYMGDQRWKNEKLITNLFYFYNESLLKQSKRSWRLPQSLGGLGLPFGTVSRAAKMYANGILKGMYSVESITSPSFGMYEESKIMYRHILAGFSEEEKIQAKYIRSNDRLLFWETPNFELLGHLDEYFPYSNDEVFDVDKFMPKFLHPDIGEQKTYERFDRDIKDAQKHPYLATERDWDSFRDSYHIPGYTVKRVCKTKDELERIEKEKEEKEKEGQVAISDCSLNTTTQEPVYEEVCTFIGNTFWINKPETSRVRAKPRYTAHYSQSLDPYMKYLVIHASSKADKDQVLHVWDPNERWDDDSWGL